MAAKPYQSRLDSMLTREVNMRVHHEGADEQAAFEQATAPVSDAQMIPIIKKLRAVFLNAVSEAQACGMKLAPQHCMRVIDEALLESINSAHIASFPQDVEGAYMLSLYEELIQQPSNIFDTVTRDDGRQYYVALSPALWRRCLERLKQDFMKQK
jgi:hypothetical protein